MSNVKANGRIRTRELQKILDLQIWISTVFRVLRQFLTTTCDALRVSQARTFFYPRSRKHREFVIRLVFDLKYRHRINTKMAGASINFFWGRLLINEHWLSSGASGSFGMAGILHFGCEHCGYKGFAGLFWQLPWKT